jgi:hypothetical protein
MGRTDVPAPKCLPGEPSLDRAFSIGNEMALFSECATGVCSKDA